MYAGREWFYEYRELFDLCEEHELLKISNAISKNYAELTKSWDIERNSEWCCRIYLCTKMILNATVLINSLDFSKKVGMRIANSYLAYYATLSLLRAVVFTLPSVEWNDGELITISHQKAINLAFDWLSKFDCTKSNDLKDFALQLKNQREIISYKIPASGDFVLEEYDEFHFNHVLTLLAEVAQFNSELLERSVTKNASDDSFVLLSKYIEQIKIIRIADSTVVDREDAYRLDYVRRKMKRPYNLRLFMTEGQTEDFMGAWDGDEENDELFNNGSPSNWQTIFDIP